LHDGTLSAVRQLQIETGIQSDNRHAGLTESADAEKEPTGGRTALFQFGVYGYDFGFVENHDMIARQGQRGGSRS
ncbi:MAG: hypothetical protein K6G90_03515, partial [Clostridia bacterium]|nr:hypothetical protein [Clostridia bacterium]